MKKILILILILAISQVFSTFQERNASKITKKQLQYETRARAIAAGHYNYAADTDLFTEE